MSKFSILSCLLFFLPLGVSAAEGDAKPEKKMGVLTSFLLLEGLSAANSGLAAASPKMVGWVELALLPFGLAETDWKKDTPTEIAVALGYTGIAVYNITVPKQNDLSKSTIFARNMIGWNLTIVGGSIVYLLTHKKSDLKKRSALKIHLAFADDGGNISARYRF
jgi:hypothetical protein